MGTVFNPLLAIIVALGSVGPAMVDHRAAPEISVLEPRPARIELVDMPDELVPSVVWAVALFEQADLELPPIRFVDHGSDLSPCSGYHGVHEATPQRSVIGLCDVEPGPLVEALILHELSHAWLEHSLSDAREADFRAMRGYEYWRNHDEAAWYENGCEQAAEIMTWALIDRPIGVVTIHDHSCDDLDAGYRALAGAAPLHGYRDHC